jgi:hypothetical protein
MWSRFTEEARAVVLYAQEAARERGDQFVGAEHVAIGLFRPETTTIGMLVSMIGVRQVDLLADYERITRQGPGVPEGRDLELSAAGKRLMDGAVTESRILGDDFIGAEHLLLGLLSSTQTSAAPLAGMFGRGAPADSRRSEIVRGPLVDRGITLRVVRDHVHMLAPRTLLRSTDRIDKEDLLRTAASPDSDTANLPRPVDEDGA